MNIFLMVISVLLVNQGTQNSANAVSDGKILKSFKKVLDYSLQKPDLIGLSGIFGVVRAKALLTDVIMKNKHLPIISILKKKCQDLLNVKKNISIRYHEWVENISDPYLWKTKISYKWLKDKCFHHNKNKTKLLMSKLRNEAETACITPEMFDFCVNYTYYTKNLYNIDQGCSYFFFSDYKGIGYETTHRLLFLQISRIWKYFSNSQIAFVESLCEYIYQQAAITQENSLFFDLFLEQIFLCGVEGYKEFLDIKWLKIMLDNQLNEGCFPLFSKKTKFNDSSIYSEQCSDHATGLASATLALHIHFRSQSNLIHN